VQAHGVVLVPGAVEFAIELGGVADLFRCGHSPLTWLNSDSIHAWSLGVDRAAEALHDRASGHELPRGVRAHLVGCCRSSQHRQLPVVEGVDVDLPGAQRGQQAGVEQGVEAGLAERGGEGDLNLGGGLLRGDQRGQPPAGHDVDDRHRDAAARVKWVRS
jgi:hypothetical protein